MTEVQTAVRYYNDGFNCAQAVYAAFAPRFGVPTEQALCAGRCFGGGMCRGEVCGAVTGALMALGQAFGAPNAADADVKSRSTAAAREYLAAFREKNGSYVCRELLGYDLAYPEQSARARELGLYREFCPKMVASAAQTLEELLRTL